MYSSNKQIFQAHIRSIFVLSIFIISAISITTILVHTSIYDQNTNINSQDYNKTPLNPTIVPQQSNIDGNIQNQLDPALYNWINSSTKLDPSLYRFDVNNNPIITVHAAPNTKFQSINSNMNVDSFIDLGQFGYLIFGSISSSDNLLSMTKNNPYLRVAAEPFRDFRGLEKNTNVGRGEYDPTQFISADELFVTQANAMNCGGQSCNGTGITVAIIDGGTDFGNSDLEPALALDSNGLPKSFDSEGWSLVATPLTVGEDIPISSSNTTLLFSKAKSGILNKLQINDPGDQNDESFGDKVFTRGWEYWHNNGLFMTPKDWTINASWINMPNQAKPKFGIGVEHWEDIYTGKVYYGYLYALLIDENADSKYDSAVIDMETSAWASYLKYIADGGHETPINDILPDFDFTNDKVVSWYTSAERNRQSVGKDFTFAKDWNDDGYNDWSFGSMANAYNRNEFLPINTTIYGKIVNGVDPLGTGFVALYPYGYGFSAHGTWTGSVAASRGVVEYNIFSNNTNSWDYPYGNSSTRTLPGSGSGADLMSVSFGAGPQDELIAWFWAAGFDLTSNYSENTVNITGAQWKWSGEVRANITSNSWGIGGLYWSGFWGNDWLSDLMSLPNLGGGPTYVRNINELWSSQVLAGSSTETNLVNINYFNDFKPFNDTVEGNTLYIGSNSVFSSVGINTSVISLSELPLVVEYYNGSQWRTLSINNNLSLTELGTSWFDFIVPSDWKLSSFNEKAGNYYWIRIIVTNTSTLQISDLFFEIVNPYLGYPGILMVTSAGNDFYYQSTGNAIGTLSLKVGATSSGHAQANQYGPNWNETNFQVAYFSSAGPKSNGASSVDVVAPGFFVYSAAPVAQSLMGGSRSAGDITQFGGDGTNAFVRWAGTSASAPAVAGVAAIAYQAYIAKNPGESVNPNLIKQIIKSTATNLNFPSNIQGTGQVNASAIVEFIQNPDSSDYFLVGSNKSYEDQLEINSWLSHIGGFFYYYAYSQRDHYADVYDFPVTKSSLIDNNHHYDVDLSTNSVTKGDIETTQVMVQNNGSGNIQVNAVHSQAKSMISKVSIIDSNDHFQSKDGDYQINISIADMNVWNSDFIEIVVKNIRDFDNVSLFLWNDFDGDGYLEMANSSSPVSNGSGEISRIQYEYTGANQTYGILKIGNPSRFTGINNSPYLILKGNSNLNDVYSPNWAAGKVVEISIKSYDLYSDWSDIISSEPWKTESGTSYFNISINTTKLQAGYHFGFLQFTESNSDKAVLMPVSIKVNFGEIDGSNPENNPGATPTNLGNFTIPHTGNPYEIGFRDGSMVWVPFSVNESTSSGSNVLAIRVTQISEKDSDIGFVLHYDETPNNFDSNWLQISVSANNTGIYNGHNVNWQYLQWEDVGFGSDTFISRLGYFRFGNIAEPSLISYKLGLFTTNATDETNVTLEMYWLPSMPNLKADLYSESFSGRNCEATLAGQCVYTSNNLRGPNVDLNVTAVCSNCDPNLPTPEVMFTKAYSEFNITTGEFQAGYDPGISIDWIEKRYFQKGDLIEFTVLPTEQTDLNLWIFSPEKQEMLGLNDSIVLPFRDTGVIFSNDFLFDYATGYSGEIGHFIAQSTGNYWFGIDNFQPIDSDWVLFTKSTRGTPLQLNNNSVKFNTMTYPGYGSQEEATFDPFTGGFDKSTHMLVGATTPTGLDNGLSSYDLNIDNYVAPFVNLRSSTLQLNESVVERREQTLTFDWDVSDPNGNQFTSLVIFSGPTSADFDFKYVNSQTYTWQLATAISDGWWNILIYADDSDDPSNTINGTNFGGLGSPAYFRIFLHSFGSNDDQSENVTRNDFSSFAFLSVGAFLGMSFVASGYIVMTRRSELTMQLNKIKSGAEEKFKKIRSRDNE